MLRTLRRRKDRRKDEGLALDLDLTIDDVMADLDPGWLDRHGWTAG